MQRFRWVSWASVAAANQAQQDAALRERLGGDIYRQSAFHRARLDRAGFAKTGMRHVSDLAQLPPMYLEDVTAPSTLLLQRNPLKVTLREAHRYWPLQWVKFANVPVAYSAEDLGQLSTCGRQLLEAAGVARTDVIANLLPAGPSRDYWQFVLGAQRAGVSAISLPPESSVADVDLLCPTVLIGTATTLRRVLDESTGLKRALDQVHTTIVVGDDMTELEFGALQDHLDQRDGAVVRAWAPDGVLALWGECRGGTGFHVWPGTEIIELVDPLTGMLSPPSKAGHLVWTGLHWYSTAMVRLQTSAPVVLIEGKCEHCGRMSSRLELVADAPGFVEVLDNSELVGAWAAELQRNPKGDELVVWVVPDSQLSSLALLEELDRGIGRAHIMLVDYEELDQRVLEAKGQRFGDRRAFVQKQ